MIHILSTLYFKSIYKYKKYRWIALDNKETKEDCLNWHFIYYMYEIYICVYTYIILYLYL